jgi:hypothetical protein
LLLQSFDSGETFLVEVKLWSFPAAILAIFFGLFHLNHACAAGPVAHIGRIKRVVDIIFSFLSDLGKALLNTAHGVVEVALKSFA